VAVAAVCFSAWLQVAVAHHIMSTVSVRALEGPSYSHRRVAMQKRACLFVLLLTAAACGKGTPESLSNNLISAPSNSMPTSPSSTSSPASTSATITFDGLTTNGSAVSTYAEAGFKVLATSGSWMAVTTNGNPAPFIQFISPAMNTVTGAIEVTAGGGAFGFNSVDLYSSATPIPYTITGLRNSTAMFTMASTVPDTFGNFATVVNPNVAALIDTVVISLSDPCCFNRMGVDNIVVTKFSPVWEQFIIGPRRSTSKADRF
jgi:hypothetical protein